MVLRRALLRLTGCNSGKIVSQDEDNVVVANSALEAGHDIEGISC